MTEYSGRSTRNRNSVEQERMIYILAPENISSCRHQNAEQNKAYILLKRYEYPVTIKYRQSKQRKSNTTKK